MINAMEWAKYLRIEIIFDLILKFNADKSSIYLRKEGMNVYTHKIICNGCY